MGFNNDFIYIYIYISPPPRVPPPLCTAKGVWVLKWTRVYCCCTGSLILHSHPQRTWRFGVSASPRGPWKLAFGSTFSSVVCAVVGEPRCWVGFALKNSSRITSRESLVAPCPLCGSPGVVKLHYGGTYWPLKEICLISPTLICTQTSLMSIARPLLFRVSSMWQMDHTTATAEAALATCLRWFKHILYIL